MAPDERSMLLESLVHRTKNHTLFGERVLEGMVNHLAVILTTHSGEELLLCLRHADLVKYSLNPVRYFLPSLIRLGDWLQIVVHVVPAQSAQICSPCREGQIFKLFQGRETSRAHPHWFTLMCRNLADHVLRKTAWGAVRIALSLTMKTEWVRRIMWLHEVRLPTSQTAQILPAQSPPRSHFLPAKPTSHARVPTPEKREYGRGVSSNE